MKTKICFFLWLFLSALNSVAQNKIESLNQYFKKLYEYQQFNGNVLIADHGKIIYEKSFGYADFPNKRLNNSNSSFPIASITKTITSTAILQLRDKGKLEINDLVIKYLPDFPYPTLTLKNLLSHTSGLPIYDDLFFSIISRHPDTVFTNKDLLPTLIGAKLPLSFQPGSDFQYNNVNFNILAIVIEKISGLSYNEYLQKNIFQPAGMSRSSLSEFFKRKDQDLSKLYSFKHTYSYELEEPDTTAEFHGNKGILHFNFHGHGDAISTAADLLKYDQALQNDVLICKESMNLAFTPVKLTNGQDNIQKYGLGWIMKADTINEKIVRHDGGLPGLRSILVRNLTQHQTIILIDNTGNNVIPLSNDVLKILNGINITQPTKSGARTYSTILLKSGIAEARNKLTMLKQNTLMYSFDENELNLIGYEFMANNQNDYALDVFKLNSELFPSSWNTFDSYGEILLKMGRKEEAIKMYQKSMLLNPANQNGKKVLEEILK
ncbi:serine hydrolase [Pedobacter sp. L105]|uniref:serine hydrolase n=1 Tax=Pedobacter sp. L105 TaxID=1641871 RepID=UPI00131BA171|nr:serine hydrolase [Pedobacter sp. L105]